MNYKICEANFKPLQTKLARLNAQLAKIGATPVTYTVTGTTDEPSPTDATKIIRYHTLEVSGTGPSTNGWSFAATLVHTADGNIVRSVPGYEVPKNYRDNPTYCEHCRVNRVRHDTYVVRHTDGRAMQVGSSCLEDFIGAPAGHLTKASAHLLNAFDVCDAAQNPAWLGGSNALSIFRIDLDTFLGYVAAVVLKDGRYVTRKMESAEQGTATSTQAYSAMRGQFDCPVTPEARALADAARQWVLTTYSPVISDPEGMSESEVINMLIGTFKAQNRSLSDFEHNLLACARTEAIEPRLCGIAAYIVEMYRKSQPKKDTATKLDPHGLLRIAEMFGSAKAAALKYPSIMLANEFGTKFKLSPAGAASKNEGCIYVKSGLTYLGKITPEGLFCPVQAAPANTGALLMSFAADPEGVASKYGKLTGCCCFCNRPLTDARSTEVGYGEICSKKFGVRYPLRSELRNVQELVAA